MKMKKKMILLVSLLLLVAAVLGGMPQDACRYAVQRVCGR